MVRILGIFLIALVLASCNRTSYYVPPDKFADPVSAQCRGHSGQKEFMACKVAAQTGRSYADVWREMNGYDLSGVPTARYNPLLSPLTYPPPCTYVDGPDGIEKRCGSPDALEREIGSERDGRTVR